MKASSLAFDHRRACIYSVADNAPTVYSLQFHECGEALIDECAKLTDRPFNLVTISGLHWDEELSPWPADKIISKDDRFTGEADSLLQLLTRRIVPEVEKQMGWQPTARLLSGYSMSGLFALYAAFRTDLFSAIVSASGSLWFPQIVEFAEAQSPSTAVRRAYFSIGDKESRNRHPYMSLTESNTRAIANAMRKKGIETTFELNSGNHFNDTTLREAKGIAWALRP